MSLSALHITFPLSFIFSNLGVVLHIKKEEEEEALSGCISSLSVNLFHLENAEIFIPVKKERKNFGKLNNHATSTGVFLPVGGCLGVWVSGADARRFDAGHYTAQYKNLC